MTQIFKLQNYGTYLNLSFIQYGQYQAVVEQFHPPFDLLFEGVRFGLQTLSFYVFFMPVSTVKNNRKNTLSNWMYAFCLISVLLCLHSLFWAISPGGAFASSDHDVLTAMPLWGH
jgi:hypothetical protein